jgi:hypothetical protein
MATLQISFHAFSEMRMCLLAWQFVDEAFSFQSCFFEIQELDLMV